MSPIVLSFSFEHGRFHGTTWRANPFDDPEGEWPPSPWRIVRALIARAHQWARESGETVDVAGLARALCSSEWSYTTPLGVGRGPTLKQYHQVVWGWNPPGAKDDRRYGPKTSLVPDSSWLTADEPTRWVLDGGVWTDAVRELLARTVERLTYLGRAESVCRVALEREAPEMRGQLKTRRQEVERNGQGTVVRVLVPEPDASYDELCVTTDHLEGGADTPPPGARWMYTWRPAGGRSKPKPNTPKAVEHTPVSLIQFALGFHVPPRMYAWTRLTHQFRCVAIKALERLLKARNVPEAEIEAQCNRLAGKDADGHPLRGHKHAHWMLFSAESDPRTAVPARLVVWREEPFGSDEVQAILDAAKGELFWGPNEKKSPWGARAIPLDREVPSPKRFDSMSCVWESATPWVPARCGVRSNGKLREGLAPDEQLAAELKSRGLGDAQIEWLDDGEVNFLAVRVPKSKRAPKSKDDSERATTPTRGGHRGFRLRLTFDHPVSGPIALGHSSHFGLGWFTPEPQ